jgi:hypothetical protein
MANVPGSRQRSEKTGLSTARDMPASGCADHWKATGICSRGVRTVERRPPLRLNLPSADDSARERRCHVFSTLAVIA